MSQSDPCSVVRIAIALAALKHKPRDQSTASYLLDLHSRFPAANKDNVGRDWRTYALELEEQLATLKAQRDADQELLSKLPTDASQVASASDAPPPKKKSKKNPTRDQHDPVWRWDQSRADWSRVLSSQYPLSPSLVAAYTSLNGVLASPNVDVLSYASRLADAILRALDTAHLFLFSPPNPRPSATALGPPLQLKPEHIDSTRIALASPLLMYVLQTALHALVCTAQDSIKRKRPRQRHIPASTDAHAYVDKVLDHLLERVLLALLRALAPLCSARLAPLVPAPHKKDLNMTGRTVRRGKDKDKDKRTGSASTNPPKKTDVRTDVFALIGASLEALNALPPLVRPTRLGSSRDRAGHDSIVDCIRDRLGLEAIRELETLYAVPPPPHPSSQQPPATRLEPQPPPQSTPTLTPPSAQPQPQPQAQAQQGAAPESRTKRLERLAGTRTERVRALATRDAGWFLASTLNLCVTPAPTADNPGGLLREALLDRIGRLVRSVPFGQRSSDAALDDRVIAHGSVTDSMSVIDPVCQNMLLAICERALCHLASS